MSRLLLLNLIIAFFAVTVDLVAQTDANLTKNSSSKAVVNGIIEHANTDAEITFRLYKDYITFEEINHTVPLKDGIFSISFDLAEPTPGFLVYGPHIVPIFLEQGDDLVIHSQHAAFVDSLQYFEEGALRNTYLKESYLLFDKNDAQLVKAGMTQNTINDFEQLMDDYKEEKFAFLHNFLTKRDTSFSTTFAEYVETDINYWWGQNMMSYRDNHPASHLLPISLTLPEEYYEFLSTLDLNNEKNLNNANYLKFLDRYMDWRQNRIAKGLVKFEGQATRKEIVSISRVETFAEVMMYDLDVRAKAHDPNSVIGKLNRKSKVLYLRDKTSDRFKYPYGGTNYIDHFVKIQMPDGQAGWVFSMGVRIFEDVVTENIEVDLPKDTDDRLNSLKYANFKGRVLHYAISRDLYDDISKGKRVRKSIIDKYIAASTYQEYNSILRKAYTERGYNQPIPMNSLRGTSAEKLVMEEKLANFTKNLANILEATELEQKSNKPKAKIITKQPLVIIAESTKSAPMKIVENTTAVKAVASEATVSVPDFSAYEQETLLRFKTNFSSGDRPSIIINQNPLLNDRQEKKLSNFTTGRAFISIPVTLSAPTTWELRNGGEIVELYYQPGDKIDVEIAGSDIYTQTVFSGKGSAANTYLLKAAQKFLRIKKELPRNIKDAKPQAFKAYLDNVRQEKLDFFYEYLNEVGLDGDFVAYAEADINYWYAFNLMNYLYEHPYLNDLPSPMEMPTVYYDAIQTIPVNNDAALPNKFFVHYIQEFIAFKNKQDGNSSKTRYELAEEYLTGNTRDFFKAILFSLDVGQSNGKGLSHEINDFSEITTDKVYGEFVKMAYHKAKGIEEGMLAPNFTLLDRTGKEVQLSDYKGKVVFLDFWATWCGPCMNIMPLHKSLHEQFKGKNIEFVYVSMDTSPALWKNFLTKKQLAGEHLISGGKLGLKSTIAVDYKIKYLPYTLLLDGNGTIVWQRTGGFSVNNVSKEIERLLSEE